MPKAKNSKICIRCKKPFPYDGMDVCEECMPLIYMDNDKLGQMLQEIFDLASNPDNKISVDDLIKKVSEENGINGKEVFIKRSFIRYLKSNNKVKCHVCKQQINKISTQKFKLSGIRICYRCLLLIDSSDFKKFKLMTIEEVRKRELNQIMAMMRKNKIQPLHTFERSSVGS